MASGVEINRSNIVLPPDISAEIIQGVQEASAIMQLAKQIALPGRGTSIPVITGDPVADWVEETAAKPVSTPSLDKKIMQAHKLAVIVPFSNEFRRDIPNLYDALIARLPGVLAKKFDSEAIFGGSSLSNFDPIIGSGVTHVAVGSSVWEALVEADTGVSSNGGILNGWIFSPQGKGLLLSATDNQNRPVFVNSVAEGGIPQILGAPAYVESAAYVVDDDGFWSVGVAGDWTQAMYGTVEGVKIDISDQATLVDGNSNTINLFQQNMFAVRAEIEVGFVCNSAAFSLITAVGDESES